MSPWYYWLVPFSKLSLKFILYIVYKIISLSELFQVARNIFYITSSYYYYYYYYYYYINKHVINWSEFLLFKFQAILQSIQSANEGQILSLCLSRNCHICNTSYVKRRGRVEPRTFLKMPAAPTAAVFCILELQRLQATSFGFYIWQIFLSRLAAQPNQRPIPWVMGTIFLVVKRPRHETEHSPIYQRG